MSHSDRHPLSAEDLDPYDGPGSRCANGKVVAHAADEEALKAHPHVEEGDLAFPVGHPVTGFYMINV